MKLILSSTDFSHPDSKSCVVDHLGMPLSACRLLYIPNEKVSAKQMRGPRFQMKLASFGFDPERVTVLDYYRAENFLNLDIDALYIGGGNTFSTLSRIRNHGFADAILSYVRSGAVYIGGSCGAHIACRDIRHVLAFDENRCGTTDFSGLGLFHGRLVCHYSEARKGVFDAMKNDEGDPVYALRNGDSIVAEDGNVRFFPAQTLSDLISNEQA